MNIPYVVLGLVIGIFVAGPSGNFLLGAAGGVFLGILFSRLARLQQRIQDLEQTSHRSRPSEPLSSKPEPVDDTSTSKPAWPTGNAPLDSADPVFDYSGPDADSTPEEHYPGSSPGNKPSVEDSNFSLLLSDLSKRISSWFSTGNVPVKVGVIISFIGVSFLLKYAIDHKLLSFPIELRLLMIAGGGMAAILIGWRLRIRRRVYALSLQGGGVGVLFLTIYAAFRIWQLLPPTLAMLLLIVVTVFSGLLALVQNSKSLALLGITGGFLAPILTSTGQGSHVFLFSYYLVLNFAVLGIAWFRSWRELNFVGFIFTFVIGSLWGYQYYSPELRFSTQPFLILHFVFYNAIAVLYSLRQPPERIGVVDGTLVFGTPVIALALQASLMHGTENGLAISAGVAAIFYAMLASWLYRNKGRYLQLLTESFIALAVVFATLTIPLALDAFWTAGAWAMEGAALVWIGTRQSRQLSKVAGVVLIFLSGGAFILHGWQSDTGFAIINGNVLGGLVISLSSLFASRRLYTEADPVFGSAQTSAAAGLFLWALLWWLGTGFMETIDRSAREYEAHIYLLFVTLSALLAARLGQSGDWKQMRTASRLLLPFMLLLSIYQSVGYGHLLRELGWLCWPLAWAVQVYLLRIMDKHADSPARGWHMSSLFLLTATLALESSWWMQQIASTAWSGALATVVCGAMAMLVWRCRHQPAWPVARHPETYFKASIVLVLVQLVSLLLLSLDRAGNPEPWPYIPLLNPFDLATLFAIMTSWKSLAVIRREKQDDAAYIQPFKWILLAVIFTLATITLVRAVHFYTGVPWNSAALFNSDVVQTVLSISWGLMGFGGMIFGAWKKHRTIWLIGAGFMALVVLKLFLIDLGNSGTIERIVSFMGIGALLLVVGYFAPAPPRRNLAAKDSTVEDSHQN